MAASGWCATGHLPEREIMTGIGPVAVRCPRVRDRGGGLQTIAPLHPRRLLHVVFHHRNLCVSLC